ncbi:DUF3168 domain-containing protein [Pigmentiphaga sp. YJ18]|uniref:DUF3168 domain-containing protein n=1 Tax=Pigmentiphaga sp. YJ18 TaxID=3134907 RepID=UPI00310F7F78
MHGRKKEDAVTPLSTLVPPILNALVDGRVFPDVAPEGTPEPWIVYGLAGGTPIVDLDGLDELAHSRLQIDVYSSDSAEAEVLMRSVVQALASTLQAMPIGGPVSLPEGDTRLIHVSQDFSLFH